MADSTDDLCLWGYGLEAILDVFEDAEEVEEQFAVLFRNVSRRNGNFESKFRITVLKFATQSALDSSVNKRNPTNAHSNIKIIYCFPSMKISCRTLLKQGILI